MGRRLPGRANKWHFSAANFLSAVSQMPALLSTESRSLQGEVAQRPGERREAGVETHQGAADEQSRARETVVADAVTGRRIRELISQILSHVPVTAASTTSTRE